MSKVIFDLDVLRSFVTGMDLGSFAKAADRLGRSTSAVSAQIRKLEEQAGVPIFRKAGRGLALTEAGETMLAYARRLLDLNDEAVTALHGMTSEGWLRVGMQEDFAEKLLPAALGRFARAHPKVRIEARVGRNNDLLDRVVRGQLDFALAWDNGAAAPFKTDIATLPVRWIAPGTGMAMPTSEDGALPLVSFDDGCWFRHVGTAALDRAGRAWRIALTSPSLSGLWAGVEAGLGLTLRTPIGLSSGVRVVEEGTQGLPPLPSINLAIYRKDATLDPLAERLIDIVTDGVRDLT
ncbi:LysR family transcriptional regulator [Azospirillum sp. TSH7]|uniref:LysR substrate-binding domain-containing protein n=1 Tax=unclassified Azospirillum TaxID=2630922 RepID=UPI000D619EA7|nr:MULTISPECIES: LysR substrate-binding domain-containing protein [unclassified Azospirillum]PWC57942.1 LysR family transcriptional regulator [Azospirillum sp. TSH7]PWC66855.1 LysR family transcriptional regulator [Azospirillum sp. TSH20]